MRASNVFKGKSITSRKCRLAECLGYLLTSQSIEGSSAHSVVTLWKNMPRLGELKAILHANSAGTISHFPSDHPLITRRTASQCVKEIIEGANKAAAVGKAGRSDMAASSDGANRDSWLCPSCQNLNLWWRSECSRCRTEDMRRRTQKASPDEIVAKLNERYHPALNRYFLDIGISAGNGRSPSETKIEAIVAALQSNPKALEPFLRMVTVLSDPDVVLECALDQFGNYSIQDVIESAFKLRHALASTPGLTPVALEAFKKINSGLDPAGALLMATLPCSQDLAMNPIGTYVMQKLVENCSSDETLDLCSALFSKGPAILCHPKGIFVMMKAMSNLSSGCKLNPNFWSKARRVAESLCATLLEPEASDLLYSALSNPLQAKVVVEAIVAAAPSPYAFKLSARMAFRIHSLLKGKFGPAIVETLLSNTRAPCQEGSNCSSISSSNKGVEGSVVSSLPSSSSEEGLASQASIMMRDFCCMVALQTRTFLFSLAFSPDPRGPALIECLLDRMIEEQEGAWVAAIAQDLISKGKNVRHSHFPLLSLLLLVHHPLLVAMKSSTSFLTHFIPF